MKRYYVHWGEFENTYKLFYVETLADRKVFLERFLDAEPISFKKATELARREKERRVYSPMCSGYSSSLILPAEFYYLPESQAELSGLVRKGRVMCRKTIDK